MASTSSRLNWVDAVKGLTMILVVTKHTTFGVAAATDHVPHFFNYLCELTIPFRMPLFFLVAGLFAERALRGSLRDFVDKKLLHFAYFYVLWSVIQIGIKIALPHEGAWAVSYRDLLLIPVEPFGLLWFIYALAVFFLVMRALRDVSKPVVFGFALILYFTQLDTGWTMPDEFARRFVFFVSGVYGAPYMFQIANLAQTHARAGLAAGLALIALVGVVAFTSLIGIRAFELAVGYAGATGTIMLISLLAARGLAGPLSYVGERSLYVFLAFFLPMAATRIALLKLGVGNGDLITLAAVAMAVGMPLLAFRLFEKTPLGFVFVRPDMFRLKARGGAPEAAVPA